MNVRKTRGDPLMPSTRDRNELRCYENLFQSPGTVASKQAYIYSFAIRNQRVMIELLNIYDDSKVSVNNSYQ